MKRHYIYFILIPILLFVALALPFRIYDYGGLDREVRNGLDDEITTALFMLPTLLATILLLIRNRVTAILGTCVFLGTLGLAMFMNYIMNFDMVIDNLGPGPFFVLVVIFIATIVGLVQSVRLVKNYKAKPNKRNTNDLLDDKI